MVRILQGRFPGDSAASPAPSLPPVLHRTDNSNKHTW